MLKHILALTGIVLMASCGGGSGVTGETSKQQKGATVDSLDGGLVDANTRFAMRLFTDVTTTTPEANVFISPPSAAVALAMTYNGADGETQSAMAGALGLEGLELEELNTQYAQLLALLEHPDSNVQLSIANSLWARAGLPFREDFLDRNRTYYNAQVSELDFDASDAAATINEWVSDQTRGKIKQIVDSPIGSELIMFLINAIYFKGTWVTEFEESETRERPFTTIGGSVVRHPLMHQSGNYRYLDEGSFQAVSLPYGSGRLSMYVFLPESESNLPEFLATLNADNWNHWMESFREADGDLALPC
jgi:serine protease inhibitor